MFAIAIYSNQFEKILHKFFGEIFKKGLKLYALFWPFLLVFKLVSQPTDSDLLGKINVISWWDDIL